MGKRDSLAAFLRRDGERSMDSVLDTLVEAQPELDHGKGLDREALRSALHSHLPLFIEFLSGAPPTRLGSPADDWARRLAEADLELNALVHAYELGGAHLWALFARSLRTGRSALPAADRAVVLEHSTSRLLQYLRAATSLAVGAYTQTRRLEAGRAPLMRAEIVEGLLRGTVDETTAERHLGYRLVNEHVGYIAWTESGDLAAVEECSAALGVSLLASQHLTVPAGKRAIHGWFTAPAGWLARLRACPIPAGVRIACGSPQRGREGFRTSHRQALEAQRVCASAVVSAWDDIAVAALASRDPELARAFVDRELRNLADDRTLLRTLDLWLSERGSATHVARTLGVHRNTVMKRIEQIEQRLGRPVDPSNMALRLALTLLPLVRP